MIFDRDPGPGEDDATELAEFHNLLYGSVPAPTEQESLAMFDETLSSADIDHTGPADLDFPSDFPPDSFVDSSDGSSGPDPTHDLNNDLDDGLDDDAADLSDDHEDRCFDEGAHANMTDDSATDDSTTDDSATVVGGDDFGGNG